jgi:hypothetical protein
MKIPLIPIHVVTSKTLEGKLDQARADGVAEGKAFKKRQLEILLNLRVRKPIRLKKQEVRIKK